MYIRLRGPAADRCCHCLSGPNPWAHFEYVGALSDRTLRCHPCWALVCLFEGVLTLDCDNRFTITVNVFPLYCALFCCRLSLLTAVGYGTVVDVYKLSSCDRTAISIENLLLHRRRKSKPISFSRKIQIPLSQTFSAQSCLCCGSKQNKKQRHLAHWINVSLTILLYTYFVLLGGLPQTNPVVVVWPLSSLWALQSDTTPRTDLTAFPFFFHYIQENNGFCGAPRKIANSLISINGSTTNYAQ